MSRPSRLLEPEPQELEAQTRAVADFVLAHLRTLSEKSRHLPVTHPLYSRVYHSHPPLLERLRAMGALERA